MPYSTTVRTKFKAPNFGEVVNQHVVSRIQSEVIDGNIKASILVGNSPVSGHGRFLGYKDQDQYPGDRKGARPVNLFLTGELLDWYRAKMSSGGKGVTMGILSDAPEKVKARAEGNNTGSAKGVVARRFVPVVGEKFKVSTMTLIRKIFSDRIAEMLGR